MFPTIHSWEANDLTTQGFGALSDCISCEVTEELNGAFTLEMTYPLNGLHNEYIATGNVIVAKPSHNQSKQAFRINQIKKSFANNIEVYANHISYDMSGYYLRSSYTYNSLSALFTAINGFTWDYLSTYYHQFTFDTDKTSSAKFVMPQMQTLRSWMGGQDGSIIDVYGGEWSYDNFSVFLNQRRGQDTGIRISYGKNLAEYEKQKDYNDYSHVIAFWKKSDTYKFGDPVSTGMTCPFRSTYTDATKAFENQPSTADLNTYAQQQINKMNPSAQTITVTPAQIGNDVLGLGDGILVCYESVLSTRVIKTVWDVLAGEYKSLQLGTLKANITDTIKALNTGPSGDSGALDPMDYVTEISNNTNDGYVKWASGKMECWKRSSTSVNVTTGWGSVYYGTISSISYPVEFISYPIVNITAQVAGGGMVAPEYTNYSVSGTGTIYIIKPSSTSGTNVTINIHCVGRWK